MSYYFGVPMEYADNISATTMMLAFEVYGKRDVRLHYQRLRLKLIYCTAGSVPDALHVSSHGKLLEEDSSHDDYRARLDALLVRSRTYRPPWRQEGM